MTCRPKRTLGRLPGPVRTARGSKAKRFACMRVSAESSFGTKIKRQAQLAASIIFARNLTARDFPQAALAAMTNCSSPASITAISSLIWRIGKPKS